MMKIVIIVKMLLLLLLLLYGEIGRLVVNIWVGCESFCCMGARVGGWRLVVCGEITKAIVMSVITVAMIGSGGGRGGGTQAEGADGTDAA